MKAGRDGIKHLKMNVMKKIFITLFILIGLSSCYDDYLKDYYYNSVYFPYQINVRTFVVGEGMKIQIGVQLGGVRVNTFDRIVNYQLDNSLLTNEILSAMKSAVPHIAEPMSGVTELKILPQNYYTLTDNNKFVIKKGSHSGVITLYADSLAFLSDESTHIPTYVLPFRITNADADTVLISKNYAVIGLKYENMLFGNYWHGGITVERDAQGNIVNTINYPTTIPSPDSRAWILTTISPNSLVANGVSNISNSPKPELQITLNGKNITISSVSDATYQVEPDGVSIYNQAKLLQDRKMFLSYKYLNNSGNWCYATDTLTFRNRLRDGVNEWQDENPANYH